MHLACEHRINFRKSTNKFDISTNFFIDESNIFLDAIMFLETLLSVLDKGMNHAYLPCRASDRFTGLIKRVRVVRSCTNLY